MLRVGIFGQTDSARRKAALVARTEAALLVSEVDRKTLIENCDLFVISDKDDGGRSDLAMDALRHGCHVFSDWPLVTNPDIAHVLSKTAHESGVELAVDRPDRHNQNLLKLASRSPSVIDVVLLVEDRVEEAVMDAVDLCLLLGSGASVHKYETEATLGSNGHLEAVSFALRFHSGSLALGHVRLSLTDPSRTVFGAATGWSERVCLDETEDSKSDDPMADPEYAFRACLQSLIDGKSVSGSLYDLEESLRTVAAILNRIRSTT